MKRLSGLFFIALGASLVTGCQTLTNQESPIGTQKDNRLAELHTQLGVGYLREGKNELALQRLHRALKADPNYSPAHNAMALLYERLNEPKKAEQEYRRAVQLNPADSAAQTNFGSFLCRQGRTEEAEKRFLQAIENPLYDAPETAYANAGLCMLSAGNLETAETYLRRALELNPRLPTPLLKMSELSFQKERPLAARGYLQRYLEVAQHSAASLWLGIQIERALGDQDTAASYGMLLKANYPDSRETRLFLELDASRRGVSWATGNRHRSLV